MPDEVTPDFTAGSQDASGTTTITTVPAFAPVTTTTNSSITQPTFYEADLQKARQQEKDKLYPKISKLEEELAAIRRERDETKAKAEEERQAQEAAAKKKAEEEMDVRQLLQSKELEWKQALEAERQERERTMALLDKERKYSEVQNYRLARIEQERDNIIPELIDLVGGNSVEEIDQSIAGLVERSARILTAVAASRPSTPGVRVTAPPTGPLENGTENRQYTPEQIRDMSAAEYAKFRESIGMNGNGKGLFG